MFLKSLSHPNNAPYLDGLRGFAAMLVLCHHVVYYIRTPFTFEYLKKLLDFGFFGVPLFFILSAYTLALSWERQPKQHRVTAFYLRRFFRIFPFWSLNVIHAQWRNPQGLSIFLSNLFMFFVLHPFDSRYEMVPYGWSLGVEEFFYFFFPIWMWFCRRDLFALLLLFLFMYISRYWHTHTHQYFANFPDYTRAFVFPLSRYFCFSL